MYYLNENFRQITYLTRTTQTNIFGSALSPLLEYTTKLQACQAKKEKKEIFIYWEILLAMVYFHAIIWVLKQTILKRRKKMIGRDYSDIYVAVCGQEFWSFSAGRSHENSCDDCQCELHGETRQDAEDEEAERKISNRE